MITKLGALALTLAVASASAAPPIGDDAPASLTRLSEADLRVMFSKNLIIRQGTPSHVGSFSDEFTSKGSYFQSGKRIPLTGSYVIRGDLICIDEGLNAGEKCRALYRSPSGELWETDPFGSTTTVFVLVRIQIERTPNTLKGM